MYVHSYVHVFFLFCEVPHWGALHAIKPLFITFFVLQKQNSLHCSHIRPKDYNKASIYILYEVHTRVGPQFICS